MAGENGINPIGTTGSTQNQSSNPLERGRNNDPNDPTNQALRREERTTNRTNAGQDRVEITREARQQNIGETSTAEQNPADRTRQAQSPRQQARPGEAERQGAVRVEAQQQESSAPAEENRNEPDPARRDENQLNRQIQDVGTNQSPRVRNEARQLQPGQNAIGQRAEAREAQARQEDIAQIETRQNPPPPENRPEGTQNRRETPDIRQVIQENVQRGLGTEESDTPIDRGPTAEDTETDVQRTRAALDEREARQEVRETPAIEPPPQNLDQIRIGSPTIENPPTPGLEGSVAQEAEDALAKGRAEDAQAARVTEARKQEREQVLNEDNQETQTQQNRDPVAAQTQVGENVDRLI